MLISHVDLIEKLLNYEGRARIRDSEATGNHRARSVDPLQLLSLAIINMSIRGVKEIMGVLKRGVENIERKLIKWKKL